MTDLAVTGATDDVMMIEAEEEMTEETLAEIIVETSAETTDVAMTGITASGEMTETNDDVIMTEVEEEILDMILVHQEEIIDETHETEITIDQSAKRLLTMIGNVKSVITLIFHLEQNAIGVENLNPAVEEITETVVSKETTAKDEIEAHVESVDQEEMTVQVGVADSAEMIARVEKKGHAESVTQTLRNSVAPEGSPQVMPTTEGPNRSILVH